METAKLYWKGGWWNYYRTETGDVYSIRDGKDYFYHGNSFKVDNTAVKCIKGDELEELKKKVRFVVN